MANTIKTFHELAAFLTENKVPHAIEPATQVIELATSSPPLPGNLFLKWSTTVPFLQIVQFMAEVPEGRIRDIESAMVRLNHSYEVPCFGFDKERRRLYYRLAVPVFEGITPNAINVLTSGCINAAKEFLEPFKMVIDGRPGDEMDAVLAEVAASRKAKAAAKTL
jgi:hypothetical protein